MNSIRLWRSLLFTPANRRDLVEKALRSKADAIILDLEDSVTPIRKSCQPAVCRNLAAGEQ
jgi:citrate lyase beta subunit